MKFLSKLAVLDVSFHFLIDKQDLETVDRRIGSQLACCGKCACEAYGLSSGVKKGRNTT